MKSSVILGAAIWLYISISVDAAVARKFKSVRSSAMKRVCQFSDQENFKKNILKPFLVERVPGTEGNRNVRNHIITFMRTLGWSIEQDTFTDSTPLGNKEFSNIVAVKNPTAARRLTLACHYDSKYFSNIKFIGASDSAVPCALMLHLASSINDVLNTTDQPDLSLELIFFDGEEAFVQWSDTDSLYGSRHLAAKMAAETFTAGNGQTIKRIEAIEVFVLLDLIGPKDTMFSWNLYKQTEKLYQRLQKIEMKIMKENLMDLTEFDNKNTNKYFTGAYVGNGNIQDDHIPFLQRNVPIVHAISYPFPSVWHKETDNEQNIDYPTVFNIAKIIRVFVIEYLRLTV